MSDARAAAWAAQLATAINADSIGKGHGATVTIETTYPAALLLADVESRIDRAGAEIARNQALLESMSNRDFYRPRPDAGLSDGPLDAEEAARVNRVITSMEQDFS